MQVQQRRCCIKWRRRGRSSAVTAAARGKHICHRGNGAASVERLHVPTPLSFLLFLFSSPPCSAALILLLLQEDFPQLFSILPPNHLGAAAEQNSGPCLLFSIASPLPCKLKALDLLETQPGGSNNGLPQYPSRLVVCITAGAQTQDSVLGHFLTFF